MYQIASVNQPVGFGLSFPTLTRATFRMMTPVSVGMDGTQSTVISRIAYLNESSGGSLALSSAPQTAATYGMFFDGIFVVGAVSGAITLQGKCSTGASGIMTCRVGSYMRLFKIGP